MVFPQQAPWFSIAIALAILLPLAWFAWKGTPSSQNASRLPGLICRLLGILFIAFAIANPQRITERPLSGVNVVALLADDSLGLRIKDEGSILDRAEVLRQHLSGRSSEWLTLLGETYQIRNYRFERSLHRVADYNSLNFSGQFSNLSSALTDSQQRLAKVPLAGIVLFTDGNSTDPLLSSEELAKLPPVFPVIIGEQSPVPDIALQSVSLRQSAFGDSPLKLDVQLKSSALPTVSVRTRLRHIDTDPDKLGKALSASSDLITEQKIDLSQTANLSFEWLPARGGIQFYELTAEAVSSETEAVPPETTYANNRRLMVADRGKNQYRILYLTGRPNWEYKFLNRALAKDRQLSMVGLIRVAKREPNFEFKGRAGETTNSLYRGFGREDENERYDESVLIRMNTRDEAELRTGFPNTAEELFAYDAIVIDDLEADFFSFNQQTLIREFVKQRGGGLLVLGGVNALEDGNYQDTPIAEALPLYFDTTALGAPVDRSVHWNLTRDGWVEPWMRIRPFEADERQRLQEMPLLRVYNTLQRIKPGATTLATIEDSGSNSYPALVTRNFGSGRVATLGVGDLWRWGMQNAGSQEDLAQFWRQISRWLVKDNPQRLEFSASQTSSEKTVLNLTVRDPDFRPLQIGTARVLIKQLVQEQGSSDPNTEIEVPMIPVPSKPGQFSLDVPITEEGAYFAKVTVVGSDGVVIGNAETGWVNQPLVAEFASLSPNRAYLAQIAEATGGRLLELDQLNQLESELNARPSPVMESASHPLWHNNWLFLAALSAFLIEWLLRRKRGLA